MGKTCQFFLTLALVAIIHEADGIRNPAFAETAQSCTERYNRCLNKCAARDLPNACVRNCHTASDYCDKRAEPRRPLPLDRGDTVPNPRGKPGEAYVPPIGGGVGVSRPKTGPNPRRPAPARTPTGPVLR